jgi:cell shape-determining protein MreC
LITKMNYLLDNKTIHSNFRKKKNGKAVFIILFILVLIFGGHGIYKIISPTFSTVSYPLFVANKVGEDNVALLASLFRQKGTIAAENKKLKRENEALMLRLTDRNRLWKENATLKEAMGRLDPVRKTIPAQVISKPNLTPYDVVTIDIGKQNAPGLTPGQKVVAEGRLVLGEIIEVGPVTSRVRLFSSAGVEVPVLIGPERIAAVAKGRGGGNFSVSLPRGTDIAVGGEVVAASYEQHLLGIIGAVNDGTNQPFQTVLFRAPLNIYYLNWVEVYDL